MFIRSNASELIGKNLDDFQIVEMTEVYRVNNGGFKSQSLGFFKDPNTAVAFAGNQTDSPWHKTQKALLLTNGKEGYVITDRESVKLFDDEAEVIKIKEDAVAKLSPAVRKLLGF